MNKYVENHLTLEELQSMPTIHEGHFDNMKIDSGSTRVWLSRMTVEDGAPYNNQVTIEEMQRGVWEIIAQYEAK